MPIYEYRCPNGHQFEVMQSMSDDPVTTCQVCGAEVERVFAPIAVHFKGSGFYTTDYGRGRAGAASGDSTGGDSSSGDSESKDSGSKDSGSKDSGSKESGNGTRSSSGDSAQSGDGAKKAGDSKSNPSH